MSDDHSPSRRTMLGLIAGATLAPCIARADSPLKVGLNTNEATVPAYYAEQAGIFAKNGLSVELDHFAGGAVVAAAIAGGSLQAGASNTLSFAASVLRGLPFVAIAPGAISTSERPLSGLIVPASSPLRAAKDLNGKVVAVVSLGGIDHLGVLAFVDKNGGDAKSIQFVELPPSGVVDALDRGRIAAGMVSEPYLSTYPGIKYRTLGVPYDAISSDWMATLWIATKSWSDANASAVRAFSASLVQGATWAQTNRDKAVGLLEDWTKMRTDRLHQPYATTLDPQLIQPVLDVALRYNFLPRAVRASDLIWKG